MYRKLLEPSAISPIVMSTRLHDQSEDIVLLRSLIDEVYRAYAAEKLLARSQLPAEEPKGTEGS